MDPDPKNPATRKLLFKDETRRKEAYMLFYQRRGA